jgi:hypothetical protein
MKGGMKMKKRMNQVFQGNKVYFQFKENENEQIHLFNPELRVGKDEGGEFGKDGDLLRIELDFGKEDGGVAELVMAKEEAIFLKKVLNKMDLKSLTKSSYCGISG